jgi:hypothetical protein
MARKTTDLLDVFRTPSAPRASSGGTALERRRRVVLGGTIAGLLLALAFTAGIGLARRGKAPSTPAPALASVRRGEWILRSEVPRVSSAGAADLVEALPRELVARFPDLRGRVKVAAGSTKASMKVIVSGFRTREEAERALRALATWNVESSFPFRRAVAVEIE